MERFSSCQPQSSFSINFTPRIPSQVQEIVKAAISVAERSGNISALTSIIPVIEKSCSAEESSRFFIQMAQTIASKDFFSEALMVFSRVGEESEHYPSFDACCILIFKKGIISDNISLVQKVLAHKTGKRELFQ